MKGGEIIMEQVKITFDGDGNPTIKVEGHPGPGCHNLTKALEKLLGNVLSDKNTAEFTMPELKVQNHVNH